jgi:N-acetylmuramoyl-L-alanine amidase
MTQFTHSAHWRLVVVIAIFIASAATFAQPRRVSADDTYIVEWGDTLSHIADAFNVSVESLAARNNITDPDLIVTGQTLTIEQSRSNYEVDTQGGPQGEPTAQPVLQNVAPAAPWDDPDAVPPYFDRELIRELLIDAAHRHGWDPNLILAQAWQESYMRQDQLSWVGAIGVMQVMPETATGMSSWYFAQEMNIWYSAYDNIEVGVAYLTMLYNVTGSVELALASYYQGWASVQRDGLFPDTRQYVDRILMFRDKFAAGEM